MERKGQVTIKDIARELGISPSTVSKALKNHPDISADTRMRVNDLARKLKYNPNPIALSLRNAKSRIIGLVIPEIIHHFFSSVISGIEDVAYDAGYNVMIYQSNESYNREVIALEALASSRVEGILIAISKETRNYEHLQRILNNDIPLVMYDRVADEIQSDKVTVDDYEGAYNAVCHLAATGCKRIAHLSGPPGLRITDLRKSGYLDALRDNGLKIDRDIVVYCDTFKQSLIRTKQLMNMPHPPDAIFTVNDLTAAGVMKTAHEMGIRVPADLSLVGFSNNLMSEVTNTTLTTVDQHGYQIGQTAIQLLLDRLMNKNSARPYIHQVIKTDLIIRESTRTISKRISP